MTHQTKIEKKERKKQQNIRDKQKDSDQASALLNWLDRLDEHY